jgi:hypothetical protein
MSEEIVYYIEKEDRITEAKIYRIESKEKFSEITEKFSKENPEKKLTIIWDQKTIQVIKMFNERSPYNVFRENIESLREQFESVSNLMYDIENGIEKLEKEFCKKEED